MKPDAWLVALVLAVAAPAAAQQPRTPLVRADVSATMGWFTAQGGGTSWRDDWYHRSLYGGVETGWYWTDHLKTEIAFGGHTRGVQHEGRPVVVDGFATYETSEISFGSRKLTLAGQYQAGRNAWFHPHIGAGVDLSWESTTERIEPVFYYGDSGRGPRLLRDARTRQAEALVVRPCADVGFKAYMSPRAFFRTDVRLRIGRRIDEMLLKFGFGVDF